MILEQVAPGSRNLAPSVMHCVIASLIQINAVTLELGASEHLTNPREEF
jgi:hypothetical protein